MKMINSECWLTGFVMALLLISLSSCGGQNGSQPAGKAEGENATQRSLEQPVMCFDTLAHDFGTIIEGERVVCYFEYRNDGGSELLIRSVETTCGCTTPEWSREPLKPGEKRSMEIIFNASGRNGEQRKVVTVNSNASNRVVRLTVRANVKKSV